MVKLLIINIPLHKPQNMVSDIITHVTLNIINGVDVDHLLLTLD